MMDRQISNASAIVMFALLGATGSCAIGIFNTTSEGGLRIRLLVLASWL